MAKSNENESNGQRNRKSVGNSRKPNSMISKTVRAPLLSQQHTTPQAHLISPISTYIANGSFNLSNAHFYNVNPHQQLAESNWPSNRGFNFHIRNVSQSQQQTASHATTSMSDRHSQHAHLAPSSSHRIESSRRTPATHQPNNRTSANEVSVAVQGPARSGHAHSSVCHVPKPRVKSVASSSGASNNATIFPRCAHLLPDDFSFISPCVKYSLFFFNLIFWLIGSTLMALGIWSLLEEYDYDMIRYRSIFDFLLHISLSLFFSGLIIFLMSFAGCVGALRENLCLIKLYSILLLVLFITEVTLSTLGFIFPSTLSNFAKDRLSKDLIIKYREDSNLQNLIDIVQMEFKCCGISDNGYKDWSKNIYFHCNISNPSSERCAVPFSCCRDLNTELINIMCGYNMQNHSSVVEINKYVYTRGCVEAVSEIIERNMNMVAFVCLGSALTQLFAMFLARSLQGQIYAQRARWM